jgi:hypothetical protein
MPVLDPVTAGLLDEDWIGIHEKKPAGDALVGTSPGR